MNILVLTDFSSASQKAFDYTQVLASALNSTIFLLHILSPRDKLSRDKKQAEAIAAIQNKMATSIKTSNQVRINSIVEIGKLEAILHKVCQTYSIDLVVLGTRKKHSFLDYLLGSVSTIVINQATTPIMIIPEKTTSNKLQNIAIATEQDEYDTPMFRFLKRLSDPLKASINRVFIFPLPRDISTVKEEVYNPTWAEEEFDPEAELTIIRDISTIRGIDYFIEKYEIDLLALSIPQRKGLNKIFHRSLSKRMIYHTSVPLFLWKEN